MVLLEKSNRWTFESRSMVFVFWKKFAYLIGDLHIYQHISTHLLRNKMEVESYIKRQSEKKQLHGSQLNKAGDWRISIRELERFIKE